MSAIHCSNVSFSYSSAVPIMEDASFDLGPGWTGLVGPNGAGKSTLLALLAGRYPPNEGRITTVPTGIPAVLCPQRVDDLTPDIAAFAASWIREAIRTRASLSLDPGDLDRWDTLSPGERKRWQVGAALADDPEILLLDEPTNHLDGDARELLVDALVDFAGCGVIVSHDRSLLDRLTARTLTIDGGSVELWNAPYSEARAAWTERSEHVAEQRRRLRVEQTRTRRRLAEQRRRAQEKDAERNRVKRTAGIHDLDARGAVATGRHASGQAAGSKERSVTKARLETLSSKIDETRGRRHLGGAVGFAFERAPKEFLIRYRGPVMAGHRPLFEVDLAVRRSDRVRIAGPNGSGKTSLLACLLGASGVPDDRVLHLAQETTAGEATKWLDAVRGLPPDDWGRVMSLVALLGSEPAALLDSDQPSPGEARKLALALALGTPRWLLALDEPTNHLDLPSIERLEAALGTFPGALLLITHDDRLADAVTDLRWDVEGTDVRIDVSRR